MRGRPTLERAFALVLAGWGAALGCGDRTSEPPPVPATTVTTGGSGTTGDGGTAGADATGGATGGGVGGEAGGGADGGTGGTGGVGGEGGVAIPTSCDGFVDCHEAICTMLAAHPECPAGCGATNPCVQGAETEAFYQCLLQHGTDSIGCYNGLPVPRCTVCEDERLAVAQLCSIDPNACLP